MGVSGFTGAAVLPCPTGSKPVFSGNPVVCSQTLHTAEGRGLGMLCSLGISMFCDSTTTTTTTTTTTAAGTGGTATTTTAGGTTTTVARRRRQAIVYDAVHQH